MKIDNSLLLDTPTKINSNINSTKETNFAKILESTVHEKDKDKLYSTCQELESVFLGKILESMRATISKSDFIEKSFASETFESMLYDKYAKEISKTGSVGIADIIYKQLSEKI